MTPNSYGMPAAELILWNGTIIPDLRIPSPADFLAVTGGRVLAVGPLVEMARHRGERTRLWDLDGATVLPGFIDSHTHFLQTGLNLNATLLFGCRSVEEVLDQLRGEAGWGGEWLRAHGVDESGLMERRLPTREELDRVSRTRPIFVSRRDHHSCVVNSVALERLRVPEGLPGGDPTGGYFRADSNYWIRTRLHNLIPDEEKREALHAAARLAVSKGITTTHVLEGGRLFGGEDVRIVLGVAPDLPLEVVVYHQTTDLGCVAADRLHRVGGCLLVDGSIGSRTAAFAEPYADEPGNRGMLYFPDEELFAFVEEAHRLGLQIALHAIGDRAIGQVLDAYERAQVRHPRPDPRHRIEHAELPPPDSLDRMARLGVALGVQPAFETLWGGPDKMYANRLGQSRARRTNPLKSYLGRGLLVAGGSDSDVTPLDPLLGVAAACLHPTSEERLTVAEALTLFTASGARIAFQEIDRGALLPGMRADLVILDRNPLLTPPEEIPRIQVRATLVAGRPVYQFTG